MKRRSLDKKKIILISICAGLLVGFLSYSFFSMRGGEEDGGEMRGVWLAYVDYKKLGLCNKSEKVFRENLKAFLKEAKEHDINTVFFHVRSYDDATWKSKTFDMSKYLWNKKKPIPYDPLEIAVELAHEEKMELHAWMNPYRVSQDVILDPGLGSTDDRILTAVEEIITGYNVDGIHFDDYFYHNKLIGGKSVEKIDAETKKKHVNDLVHKVYVRTKEGENPISFGISPQGNLENCRAIGADIDTWMSQPGFVDYVAPQIYWTDEHSATWRDRMYSDTLAEWQKINERDIILYVGLAVYCTGVTTTDDPGWANRSDNLAFQVKTLRKEGCGGYILFSAKDFFRTGAAKELGNLKKIQ